MNSPQPEEVEDFFIEDVEGEYAEPLLYLYFTIRSMMLKGARTDLRKRMVELGIEGQGWPMWGQ